MPPLASLGSPGAAEEISRPKDVAELKSQLKSIRPAYGRGYRQSRLFCCKGVFRRRGQGAQGTICALSAIRVARLDLRL